MSQFKKTAMQADTVKLIIKSKATDVMLFGGARSSKTTLAVFILVVRACKAPKSNHIIVRNTFNSVKNSIFLETLPIVLNGFFPDLEIKWDKTNYRVILPNESVIKVAGLDNAEKLERLLGLQFSSILVEEANQVPFQAIQKLKTRLAEKNCLRKMVYYTQNPTTKSSALYQYFEQHINPVDGEALDQNVIDSLLSIQMNIQGNLANVDEQYLKMLERLPEAERKRFLLGEYSDDNKGAAVYAFNRDAHVSDKVKRQAGTVLVGTDFNFLYNSDVVCSMSNGVLQIWAEIQIEGDTYKKADELVRLGCQGAHITADYSGGARRTSGKSDFVILREAGFDVYAVPNPYVIDKINNLNRAFTLGLIQIHPSCKKLIRDLTLLKWDKHGQLDQKTDTSLSHLVDGLSYLALRLFPLVGKNSPVTMMDR